MKIKLLRAWKGQPAGSVLEPELHDVGRLLIQRGFAEAVLEPEAEPDKKKPKLQSWVKNENPG